ncbi:AraC family transcriptional regulator [Dysgonomonas sp. 25]|uniref:AraC family transcriptional regulator n=1 Tax=Dysgonomonas sp. 25 TaxID=2302933 RepID=UPI0013D471B8|nr:AraC family transcriptional regulator [Dysgonomonas sp. 25]
MSNEKGRLLRKLKEGQFVEIFNLEEADNTIFGDYQRYDFYQLIWFTEVGGDLSYMLDFDEYLLKDNQIVMVYPGQVDKLDPRSKKGYIFTIRTETLFAMNQRMQSDFLNGYYSNVFISLDDSTTDVLKQLMRLILLEYTTKNRQLLLENYMESFLFHISSAFEETEIFQNSRCERLVANLMWLIDEHFVAERETEFYAEKLGLTHKRINEICKRGTGKTVKQHLQERLILEIKKEIRLNEKSLKEIAFDLGFNEAAYFTRFFKQHTSMTPTEFKEK